MIRVLSYNIYYKAMMGIEPRCSQQIICNNVKCSICLKNVAKFIKETGPYDFVCLQEATNYRLIHQLSLKEMEYIHLKLGVDEMVTFYDGRKYHLEKDQGIINGHLLNRNRPFLILFFSEKIAIINIHAGHNNDIYKFNYYLSRTLELFPYVQSKQIYLYKLSTYHIIMMGDFNDNLSKPFHVPLIGSRKLYEFNIVPTYSKRNLILDHILSTSKYNIVHVHKLKNASDHYPIISDIKLFLNIGYDFDGVLHKNVKPFRSEPNPLIQRMDDKPVSYTIGEYDVFHTIIDEMNKYIEMNNNICIITARDDSLFNRNDVEIFINNHLKENSKKVKIYFTNNKSKVNLIRDLGINIFHDDSCLRITEIYTEMKKGTLPNLFELRYVEPADDRWYLVNDKISITKCGIVMQEIMNTNDNNRNITQLLKQLDNKINILNKRGIYNNQSKEEIFNMQCNILLNLFPDDKSSILSNAHYHYND